MVNPDGYEYTHTHDRTFRKARSINVNGGSGCRGFVTFLVLAAFFKKILGKRQHFNLALSSKRIKYFVLSRCDPNRNISFQFGGEGTSSNPCSNTFKGPKPLSEKETETLANFMQEVQNNSDYEITAYISFHSYGQLWLLPWGYTSGAYSDDFDDQESLGNNVVSNIYGVDRT